MLAVMLALSALTGGWSYLGPSEALPGGGPAAIREAKAGEVTLVACDRRTAQVLIATGTEQARYARFVADGMERSVRLERGAAGGTFLPLSAGSALLDGLVAERRSVAVQFESGRRAIIAPERAVTRVVRECRSLGPA